MPANILRNASYSPLAAEHCAKLATLQESIGAETSQCTEKRFFMAIVSEQGERSPELCERRFATADKVIRYSYFKQELR
ncbi:hypothetical protein [Ralstonia edaphi]|uniref:hypothetical protein n=1 Tax=Ralstonia edaphi TaxID=3058599 RepID=UPI002930DD9D|nr:hypothetical protein [Ralstonia sp. LMG 6871]